jgi:hypothetical protein
MENKIEYKIEREREKKKMICYVVVAFIFYHQLKTMDEPNIRKHIPTPKKKKKKTKKIQHNSSKVFSHTHSTRIHTRAYRGGNTGAGRYDAKKSRRRHTNIRKKSFNQKIEKKKKKKKTKTVRHTEREDII